MAALTKEELAEIAQLETDAKKEADDDADASKRQHLDALRMRKRLAPKHGKHGQDFLVLETNFGNFAIRCPNDVECDGIAEKNERSDQENLAQAILLEPTPAELQAAMAKNPGMVGAVLKAALTMLTVEQVEAQKK